MIPFIFSPPIIRESKTGREKNQTPKCMHALQREALSLIIGTTWSPGMSQEQPERKINLIK